MAAQVPHRGAQEDAVYRSTAHDRVEGRPRQARDEAKALLAAGDPSAGSGCRPLAKGKKRRSRNRRIDTVGTCGSTRAEASSVTGRTALPRDAHPQRPPVGAEAVGAVRARQGRRCRGADDGRVQARRGEAAAPLKEPGLPPARHRLAEEARGPQSGFAICPTRASSLPSRVGRWWTRGRPAAAAHATRQTNGSSGGSVRADGSGERLCSSYEPLSLEFLGITRPLAGKPRASVN